LQLITGHQKLNTNFKLQYTITHKTVEVEDA